MESQDKKQTIIEHLSELRKRIIYSIVSLIVCSIISYNFSEIIVEDMINKAPNMEFVFIAPAELFMSYIKIAIVGGIIFSLPIIIFQIWSFVKPGLERNERRLGISSLLIGGLLFLLGGLFAYLIVLPMTINFLANFQMNEIKPMISFNNYLSFAITFVLSFGVAFEMPILMALVVKFGLVNTKTLKKHRRMAILLIFVLAAILTPPDVISQISLAIPMILLFEIGLFLSKLVETNKVEANK